MVDDKKVVVVMPAYNAEKTLIQTYQEIPEFVDEVILVDDCSKDGTVKVAKDLGVNHVISHDNNKGYGGNQKTCYDKALDLGADIIIMLHPDYQYTPKLIPAMASLLGSGYFDVVLGSRILGKGALAGGMPIHKYIANRILTFVQNVIVGHKLSEYHTGYRAFSAKAIRSIDYHANSDNFVFDNQMLSQLIFKEFQIGEVSCPTKYFAEASSINLKNSAVYGLGVLRTSLEHRLAKWKLISKKRYA